MKSNFLISNITTGKLNAMVKNIMTQTGVTEPEEAVRMVNSGEVKISVEKPKWTEVDGVIRFSLTSDGSTGREWITRLEKQGHRVEGHARRIILSKHFKPNRDFTYEVVVLKGTQFSDEDRTYENILKEAEAREFIVPPMQLVCLIRQKFSNEELRAMGFVMICVMHRKIKDFNLSNFLFDVDDFNGSALDMYPVPGGTRGFEAYPYKTFGFAFISSRKLKF